MTGNTDPMRVLPGDGGTRTGQVDAAARARVSRDLVVASSDTSLGAESFRTLRTQLIAKRVGSGRRALAVCSPSAGAGCSYVAANLAIAMSQVGLRTLLIDTDMRKPSVSRLLPSERSGVGLAQALGGSGHDPLDYVQASAFPHLSVLYAGATTADPLRLLGSAAFETLAAELLRTFDVTIADTPPANQGADALRVASVLGHSLIVARPDVTMVDDVTTLERELTAMGSTMVGAVLNDR